MKEKYYHTPAKGFNPGLKFQVSDGAGLERLSLIGPLKLDRSFPIVRHAGDQYQKFQFHIGTSF